MVHAISHFACWCTIDGTCYFAFRMLVYNRWYMLFRISHFLILSIKCWCTIDDTSVFRISNFALFFLSGNSPLRDINFRPSCFHHISITLFHYYHNTKSQLIFRHLTLLSIIGHHSFSTFHSTH